MYQKCIIFLFTWGKILSSFFHGSFPTNTLGKKSSQNPSFLYSLQEIRNIQIAEYEAHINKQSVILDMMLVFTEVVCEF